MSFGLLLHDLGRHAKYFARRVRHPSIVRLGTVRVPLGATKELENVRRRVYRDLYERAERNAVSAIVRPDDVVLELGSGVGIVSAHIASCLTDPSRLVTYEANRNLEASIIAVAQANGLTYRPRIAVLGPCDGEAVFYVKDGQFESSSIIDRGDSRPVTVPMHSFDRVLDELRPTVIVADVEGAETELLSRIFPVGVRALLFEAHPHIVGNSSVSDLVRKVLSQGFSLVLDASSDRVLAFER